MPPPSENKENVEPKHKSNFQRPLDSKATSNFTQVQQEKVHKNILKTKLEAGNERLENSPLNSREKDKREITQNFSTSGNVFNQLYQRHSD
jgi:hypothetical protein